MISLNKIVKLGVVTRDTISSIIKLFTRYLIRLDPVLNSHYVLNTPITFSGDFEIEIDVVVFGTGTKRIVSTETTGDFIQLSVDNITGQFFAEIKVGATTITPTFINYSIRDNNFHKCKLSYVSTTNTFTVWVDGIQGGSAILAGANTTFTTIGRNGSSGVVYFDGILCNPIFNNLLTSNTTSFSLGNFNGDVENSIEVNNTINYVNVPDTNREKYTLSIDNNLWTNISQNKILPATIIVS